MTSPRMTAKKPKTDKAEDSDQTKLFDKEMSLEDAAKFLQEECYAVEFEVSWFGTSRKATSQEASSMLKKDDDEVDPDQIGINLKLFDREDPYIKKMNAAKTALTSYRDSVTIPSAKLPLVTTSKGDKELEVGMEGSKRKKRMLQKKPGERIIMSKDVDEFDTYVTSVLIPNLLQAVDEANEHIDEIKARSQKKLKKRFSEEAFPEEFRVGVVGPDYQEVGLSFDFESSCPKAANRMKAAAEQRFMDTVELAVADFANSFMETVSVAARQLSSRTKLMPPAKHELRKLKDAEVTEAKYHDDDPEEIPQGQMLIEVVYTENSKKITEWFGPMTQEEYLALNPYTAEERCKVFESTFEKLLGDLDRFTKIRGMLGDLGAPMDDIVGKVRKLLNDAGGDNAKKITDEVKASTFFRNQGAAILAEVADEVEKLVDKMPVKKKGRRRAIGKLKAK